MATFQPENGISSVKSDFTSSSKGFKADTSMGDLIGGVAEVLDTGVKAAKGVMNELIRSDVTKAVDTIQDMFTGNGPTPGQGNVGKQVPQDITARAERLQALTDAYKSGRINPSHYHMLLDTEARRLRTQYAGHREEIDNIFADLTGGIPANKLINDFQHEAAKKDAADAERNKWEFAAKDVPAYAAFVAANPDKQVPLAQLKIWVSEWDSQKAQTERTRAQIELKAAQKGDLIGDVAFAVGPQLTNRFDSEMKGLADGSGLIDRLQALERKAVDNLGKNVPLTQDEEKNMALLVNQIQGRKAAIFNEAMNQKIKTPLGEFTYGQTIGDAMVETKRKEFYAYVDSYTQHITDKNWSLVGASKAFTQLKTDANYSAAMTDQVNQAMVVIRQIHGDQNAANVINRNATALSMNNRAITDLVTGQMFKSTSLAEDHDMAARANKESGNKADMNVIRAVTFKNNVDLVMEPGTRQDIRENAMRKLFGDLSDQNFYSKATPKAQEDIYKRMVTTDMAMAVQKYGTADQKENFARFVEKIAGQRMNQDIQELKRLVVDTDSTTGVKYDPVAHQFKVEDREQAAPFTAFGPSLTNVNNNLNAGVRSDVQGVVDRLNVTLAGFAPVAVVARKAKPEDINYTVERTFKAVGGLDINNIKFDATKTPKRAPNPLTLERMPVVDPAYGGQQK